jgi:hypothetical protein
MALGTGLCSDINETTKPGMEQLYQWVKTTAVISPEVPVKGFKKCCIFHEVNGKEDEEVSGKNGNEHETKWEL